MKSNMRLKYFLMDKGVSQRHIAKAIGAGYKGFNAVLNGHAELRVDMLESVCKAMGVPIASFFDYEVQENQTEMA